MKAYDKYVEYWHDLVIRIIIGVTGLRVVQSH